MAPVVIREPIWNDLVAVAKSRRQKADALVEQVLRDFVRGVSDQDLLIRSEHAARRAKFRVEATEDIIRRHRRRKRT